MRKSLLILLLLTTSVATFAANITKEYPIESFTKIGLYISTDVEISSTKGAANVKAVGPQELIDRLDIKVVNNQLIIKSKGELRTRRDYYVKIYVSMPIVKELSIYGSGDIKVANNVRWTSDAALSINGSGDIEIAAVQNKMLSITTKGSGDIKINTIINQHTDIDIKGSGDIAVKSIDTNQLNASIKGSGDIELKSGKTQRAIYNTYGSGDIKAKLVMADYIEATTRGSGDISCYKAAKIIKHRSGSGNITH